MKRVFMVLSFKILFAGYSFSFNPSFPDTPVVIGYGDYPLSLATPGARSCVRDSRGWIYAVYSNKDTMICKRSTDNGRNWNTIGTLRYWTGWGEVWSPCIAIDKGDSLYVAWDQGYHDSLRISRYDIFWSRYNQISWTPPENVSKQGLRGWYVRAYGLAVDDSGVVHLVLNSPYSWGLAYMYYKDGIWSVPEDIPGSFLRGSLIRGESLDIHLVYETGRSMAYRRKAGWVWGDEEITYPSPAYFPSLAMDSKNNLHLVWYMLTDLGRSSDVFYQKRTQSGWGMPYNLSDNQGISAESSISVDARDNLYVAWRDTFPNSRFFHIYYSVYDGVSWSSPRVLTNPGDSGYNAYVHLGFPVTEDGVDIVYLHLWGKERVMYIRLPLVPSGVEKESEKLKVKSEKLKLEVFPNPATSKANFRFQISDSRLKISDYKSSNLSIFQSSVSIKIYDVTGRLVRQIPLTLKTDTEVNWDLRDEEGKKVSAGVYFVRLEIASPSSRNDSAEGKTQARRVLVIR